MQFSRVTQGISMILLELRRDAALFCTFVGGCATTVQEDCWVFSVVRGMYETRDAGALPVQGCTGRSIRR